MIIRHCVSKVINEEKTKIQILDFQFQSKHLLSIVQIIISKVKIFDNKKKIISWSIAIIYVAKVFPAS